MVAWQGRESDEEDLGIVEIGILARLLSIFAPRAEYKRCC